MLIGFAPASNRFSPQFGLVAVDAVRLRGDRGRRAVLRARVRADALHEQQRVRIHRVDRRVRLLGQRLPLRPGVVMRLVEDVDADDVVDAERRAQARQRAQVVQPHRLCCTDAWWSPSTDCRVAAHE